MTPRRKNSLKWTPLPKELCAQIREVFEENFAKESKSGQFLVTGRIYPEEICFQAGYLEKGRLAQANFEVSLDFTASKQNAFEQIQICVDCAASMMQRYFESESDLEEFPREWQKHNLDGRELYLQVSTLNSELESEADRLLGEADDALVQGEDPDEDERAVISLLGLADDEPGDGSDGDVNKGRVPKKRKKPLKH